VRAQNARVAHAMVLHADLPAQREPERGQALLESLPYGHRLELERRTPEQRRASLAGLELALAGLGRCTGRRVQPASLRFPAGGKPTAADGPSFSISHCASLVGVALVDDGEIGFDLESRAAPGAARAQGSTRAVGSPTLEHWTAVEAVLKAVGAGLASAVEVELAAGLRSARLHGRQLWLRPVDLGPGYVAAIASTRPVATVELVRVEA
jgi:phosphopantetheinyl transferase